VAVGLTLIISGFAFLIGGFCAKYWGPAVNEYADVCLAGGALMLLGILAPLVDAYRGRLGALGGRLIDLVEPGGESSHEVAALSYEVADKAFSGQAAQWQDLRGRVTTLVTIGPAAAAVIVATTNAKFDLLALLSLAFLAIAIGQSIIAIWKGRHFNQSPLVPEELPPGTGASTLQLALAQKTNELREENSPRIREYEEMFLMAAASFLLAVLLWSIHAATNSEVVFTLS
jgi:hypothetical protein